MFDFRRITLFCLEKRLSKHKITIFSKNLGGAWSFVPHLSTPMCVGALQYEKIRLKFGKMTKINNFRC